MIHYNPTAQTFTLHTAHSSYQIQVGKYGVLLHLYYGRRVQEDALDYRLRLMLRGAVGNLPEAAEDRAFSMETLPLEYPVWGPGDYRTPCLEVENADGSNACDLRYRSHRIGRGKPRLEGLPAVYDEDAKTLEILLEDSCTHLRVTLLYAVLEEQDVITRAAVIENGGTAPVRLRRALSCGVDFLESRYDFITFHGRHLGERRPQRRRLCHGKQGVDSRRGGSSHQQNPFVILCEPTATETAGECFGASFVYSGNFLAQAEVDQLEQTRLVMGIHPEGFCWELAPGQRFTTPEVALCHSGQGLGELSRSYHRLYRQNLCRGRYKIARRPVLINNWEATYFDFTGEKLLEIARAAAELGVELLVMDDGWFGARSDDRRALGDWVVNTEKLGGTLAQLSAQVNALGLQLGIWVEPEMISEESDLYRAHPDWALQIPGRPPVRSRHQLVLDVGRPEVQEYLFTTIGGVLRSANIAYVKWDFNRSLADVWSAALPPQRQGEAYHRYMLGVYALLERFVTAFPDILFEGCAGGGGRFDAGMLYYTPQIWCSDNTDARERLAIQYGTSFGYPVSAMGSHVSVCPNHQTGRTVPLEARALVAMSGTFGFELDLSRMTAEEKATARHWVQLYKKYWQLISDGAYYRLTDPTDGGRVAAWQFVSADRRQSLLCVVLTEAVGNPPVRYLYPQGLEPAARYRLRLDREEGIYSGAALMYAGLSLPLKAPDMTPYLIELEQAE